MGFIEGLSRMLRGKPVFEERVITAPSSGSDPTVTPATTAVPVQPQTQTSPPVQHHSSQPPSPKPGYGTDGRKILPEIRIQKCRVHINGDSMTVTAWVTNTSSLLIELDKIEIGRVRLELDRQLRPGEGRELTLYKGMVFHDDHEHDAQLIYKVMVSGDYFQAEYMIEYHRDSAGIFTIEDFHIDGPIRDI